MGWARGKLPDGRMAGYAVAATCDFPGCREKIDRGLSYVCGGMHEGGDDGCGGYFCPKHKTGLLCDACQEKYDAEHPEET